MGKPYSLLNQVRVYDTAFMEFLKEFRVDYGMISGENKNDYPILSLMSPPERAFAMMRSMLIRKGWIKGLTDEETQDEADAYHTVPLPFISVQQKDYTQDFVRSKAPIMFDNFERMDDGTSVSHPYPVPYDITYDVTMWCKNKYTAAFFQDWLNAKVGDRGASPNEFFIYVNLGPFGNQLHAMKLESLFETSNNAGLLYGFRDFMFLASFTLKGWVFKNPYDDERQDMVLQTKESMIISNPLATPPNSVSHISVGTGNLVKMLSRTYRSGAVFDTKDSTVELSSECSDGRYDSYIPYIYGTPVAYKITFNAVDSYARTKIMPIPPSETVVAFRYNVKKTGVAAVMNILNNADEIIRQVPITGTGLWAGDDEVFVKLSTAFKVEFVADSGELLLDKFGIYIREGHRSSTELVQDSDMTTPGVADWTAVGAAVLSKVVVGVEDALSVVTTNIGDGVSQDVEVNRIGVYILSVDVLSMTADYRLTFSNGTTSGSVDIKPIVDKSVCLVLYTSENLSVKIEQIGGNGNIILNNINIRSFFTCPMMVK